MKDKIFDFFVQYKMDHDGNSPSFETVGQAVRVSRSAVKYNVDRDDRFYWYEGQLCLKDGKWSLSSQQSDTK